MSSNARENWQRDSDERQRRARAETHIAKPLRFQPSHVFVLSLPKCGTTSLHHFLKNAGYNSVHWTVCDVRSQGMTTDALGSEIQTDQLHLSK